MSKPDWKDAPHWANWLAMDPDGYWYWYEYEPEWDEAACEWMLTADMSIEGGGRAKIAMDMPDEDGIDWDLSYDTLEERP